jgi:hypothetical protein
MKLVSLSNATAAIIPQEICLVLIYVRASVNPRCIVRPEGLNKIPMISLGNEPANLRIVTQCLKQLPYLLINRTAGEEMYFIFLCNRSIHCHVYRDQPIASALLSIPAGLNSYLKFYRYILILSPYLRIFTPSPSKV